ncbi:DNA gyrase inhibitor YacG [Xylophilus rhododendri]|uniref:DNA gyrase inhibitor YacG n=1 Tax=Xylophilus rhododendri TaxID=2697032 RepID=A0A857J3A6_9BURK|nr:DNA gyrase inhibitor YacG [Xylophilus rhododendri]QHI98147.1 DNA gyrase inhibitor YacG [Xylophilus rhododendri]
MSQPTDPVSVPKRIVRCPACGGDSVYSVDNAYRPFCSARCRGIDLGAWASESFRVPTEVPPEDEIYGDPRHQH